MQKITLKDLYAFHSENEQLIEGIKVTKFNRLYFNDMEGYHYEFNIKVTTVEGYRNKLLKVVTNDTWLEDMVDVVDGKELSMEDVVKEYFNNYFIA